MCRCYVYQGFHHFWCFSSFRVGLVKCMDYCSSKEWEQNEESCAYVSFQPESEGTHKELCLFLLLSFPSPAPSGDLCFESDSLAAGEPSSRQSPDPLYDRGPYQALQLWGPQLHHLQPWHFSSESCHCHPLHFTQGMPSFKLLPPH